MQASSEAAADDHAIMPTMTEGQNAMSEPSEERLYGLIEIADRQQNVVQTALEGMVKERIAFGQELQQFTVALAGLPGDIRSMVSQAISETKSGAEEAGTAVAQEAVESLQSVLDDVSERAGQAEAMLRSITNWLRWRFLWFGLGGVGGLAILWWLASVAVLWWDNSAVESARTRKARLQNEIAELEANRDAWVGAGLEGKLSRCGPKKRACVRVDENAGSFGDQSDFRIIRKD